MSTIADISNTLGDYMLRGWVLTDQSCPTPGCMVPLLRSPRGRTPVTTLCVKCSEEAPPASQVSSAPAPSASDISSEAHDSRPSTPPTEVSDTSSLQDLEPPPESDVSRRRREQSDSASSEIGKRLLKGWAMLADECPNDTCFGVPLVRPPKVGGDISPRKECVICGNSYVSEVDWAGRERLVRHGANGSLAGNAPSATTNAGPSQPLPTSDVQPLSNAQPLSNTPSLPSSTTRNAPKHQPLLLHQNDALEGTAQALNESLIALSGRLTTLSLQSVMDPSSVGNTADAIGKVTQALAQVRQLQRTQNLVDSLS